MVGVEDACDAFEGAVLSWVLGMEQQKMKGGRGYSFGWLQFEDATTSMGSSVCLVAKDDDKRGRRQGCVEARF